MKSKKSKGMKCRRRPLYCVIGSFVRSTVSSGGVAWFRESLFVATIHSFINVDFVSYEFTYDPQSRTGEAPKPPLALYSDASLSRPLFVIANRP